MTLKFKMPVGGDDGDDSIINAPDEIKKDANGNPIIVDDFADTSGNDPGKDGNNDGNDNQYDITGLSEVIVDDETLYVAADGNVVDKEGNIKYDKNQFNELRSQSDVIDADLIQQHSGIELLDETGKPIKFDNTVQGIAKREALIKERFYTQGKQEAISEFFNNNPVIKDVYKHYSETGKVEGYKPKVNYASITVDENNEDQLVAIISEAELKKENSPEKIKKLIEFYKANNELYQEATDALKYLDTKQKTEDANKTKLEHEATQKQIQTNREYYGYYYDENDKPVILNNEGSIYNKVVTKGQVGNFKIPEAGIEIKNNDGTIKTYTRQDIFNYIALAADDNGYSKAMIDEMNNTKDTDKLLSRYLYNLLGGNLESLIPSTMANKEVKRVVKFRSNKSNTRSTTINSGDNKGMTINLPVK